MAIRQFSTVEGRSEKPSSESDDSRIDQASVRLTGRFATIDTVPRTTISDDYKLSIQYAIGNNLTDWLAWYFRFGVIESRGGIGGNLVFFEDRSLELQADLYEFDQDRNPRLRVFGSYNLFPNLYAFAGVDDALNDYDPSLPLYGRTFTLGFGFALDDRDLKGLFSVSGVPTP